MFGKHPRPINIVFEPRQDITTYELACIMKCVVPGSSHGFRHLLIDSWDQLPQALHRHFREVPR